MPYYADCYVLVHSRNPALVEQFLERYLPGSRQETADEYEIPQYADEPRMIFRNASKLMDYLKEQPNEVQCIYWSSLDATNTTHVSVHYTSDGAMIFGVAVPAKTEEKSILNDLMRWVDTTVGYITYEEPPPDPTAEFIKKIK